MDTTIHDSILSPDRALFQANLQLGMDIWHVVQRPTPHRNLNFADGIMEEIAPCLYRGIYARGARYCPE